MPLHKDIRVTLGTGKDAFTFTSDFHVLDLPEYDFILGKPWLRHFDPMYAGAPTLYACGTPTTGDTLRSVTTTSTGQRFPSAGQVTAALRAGKDVLLAVIRSSQEEILPRP